MLTHVFNICATLLETIICIHTVTPHTDTTHISPEIVALVVVVVVVVVVMVVMVVVIKKIK